jgi:hypothetical protein
MVLLSVNLAQVCYTHGNDWGAMTSRDVDSTSGAECYRPVMLSIRGIVRALHLPMLATPEYNTGFQGGIIRVPPDATQR